MAITRRWQYQVKTEPVLAAASVILLSWFQPLSEPVQIREALGVVSIPQQHSYKEGTILPDKWNNPLSEPVRTKVSLPAPSQQFFATDTKWSPPAPRVDSWFVPFPDQVQIDTSLSAAWQQYFSGIAVPTPSAAITTNWYSQLSDPVRQKLGLAAGSQQFFATDAKWTAPAPRADSWYNRLSEPVRTRQAVAYQQPFTIDWKWSSPTVTVTTGWLANLSEPIQIDTSLSAAWHQYFSGPTVPSTVSVSMDGWYRLLAEPVRSKPNPANEGTTFTTDWKWSAPAPRMDSWYKLLAEPVRSKIPVSYQQPFATDWKWERPAVQSFPNWFNGFTDPVRQKLGLQAASQQFFATDAKWNAPAPRADSWFKWLSEPVRSKQGVAYQQPFTIDWKWSSPTVVYNWFQPLSERVPINAGLGAAGQQVLSVGTGTIFVVYADSWHQLLSEPVRSKAFPVENRQFFAADWKWSAPASRMDSWYRLLSEPVRSRVPVAYQQPFTTDWKFERPAVQNFPNWFGWLSDPVRQKLGLQASSQQFFATDTTWNAPAPRADSWFKWLAEPVRFKVAVAYQQPFTMDWRWTPPGAVTDLRNGWFNWLSDPAPIDRDLGAAGQQWLSTGTAPAVTTALNWFDALSDFSRVKPGLLAASQQYFSTDTNWNAPAPRLDSWYNRLAEPVRSKTPVVWQQPFTTDWQWTAPVPRLDSWFNRLSEPVRFKIPVAYQLPFTMDRWTAPGAITDLRSFWYSPLSEPVRQKLGLLTDSQQFFAIDAKWTPPAPRADSWYGWLSEPVRSKQAVAYQQFFTTDWKWSAPPAVTDLRAFWYAPLSEPVRFKVPVAWQQPFTTDWKWTAPASRLDSWYRNLSEPVRSKPTVHPRHPFLASDAKWTPPAPRADSWFHWLSEPVRDKLALRAGAQQFFTTDWTWLPPLVVHIDYWHQALAEPIQIETRLLGAAWQQTLSIGGSVPPPAPVTYRLVATETGDTGLLRVFVPVTIGGFVTGADVTIVEISPNMANVAIIEIDS